MMYERPKYKLCNAPNCDRPARTRGYCPRHYQQVRKYGRLTPEREQGRNPPFCIVAGCDNEAIAKGYCWKHYLQIRRHGRLTPERKRGRPPQIREIEVQPKPKERVQRVCMVEACSQKHYARGYCNRHYQQWWRAQRKTRHEAKVDA